ncbi:MAG TPA: hypothetical protein VLS90_06435, partial [Thermodesulfobacteriota bacterium]|nr:hypothetical protein [Thermodesulfobacteriota bacterium]
KNINLVFDPKDLSTRIPVHAEFDPEKIVRAGGVKYQAWERKANAKKLIEHGLRGQLQIQSIVTGQLMINLDFLPNTKARLVSKDPDIIEIPTVPTVIQQVADKLQDIPIDEIIDKMTSALEGFNTLVNTPELQGVLKNTGPTLDEVKTLMKAVNEEFRPVIKQARALMNNVDRLVVKTDQHFDPLVAKVEKTLDEVGPMMSDLKVTMGKANTTLDETQKLADLANREAGPMIADLKKTMADAQAAMARAEKTLEAAEANFYEGSEFYETMTDTLQRANETARAGQILIEYLQRNPDAVVWGKKDRR